MGKGGDTTAAGTPPPIEGPAHGRPTNDCALGHKPRRAQSSQTRPGGPPCTAQRRAAGQRTPATPVGQTHRRERHQPARHVQQIPEEWGLALAARGVEHERKPTDFLLHPPGGGHASWTPATRLLQRKGRQHARTRHSTSPSSPAGRIHKGPGKGPGQTREAHGQADDHENVNEQSSRVVPSKASIQGYVHRGDWRAPPPRKVTRLGRWWGYGTYKLRERYEGHAPGRKLTKTFSGRGVATLPGVPVLRNATRGTREATGSPQGATPTRYQRARMCYAEPNPPRRIPAPQHKPNRPNHPNHQTQHRDTGTPPA